MSTTYPEPPMFPGTSTKTERAIADLLVSLSSASIANVLILWRNESGAQETSGVANELEKLDAIDYIMPLLNSLVNER